MIPEPSIRDMLDAGAKAVRGSADKNADFIRGSDYESLLGPCAVIWSRQAQRDTDLFNAVNFHTADGNDLTEMALQRYGKERILDTRGTGTISIARDSGGTDETVWTGTRILITGANPKTYRVTSDTVIDSSDLTATAPIEALEIGPGTSVNITDSTGTRIRFTDTLADSTWKITQVTCGEGTVFEEASVFRTRIRTERLAERVGQEQAIIDACISAGAENVALFRSNYAGDAYDYGLNVCYVGDSGYESSQELVDACFLAIADKRVAGAALQVQQMAPASLAVEADVYLIDSPGRFDLERLEAIHTAAILQYMNGTSGAFSYSLMGILGAIIRRTPEVHRVNIISPTTDATITVGAMKNFPAVLTRYVVSTVTLNYLA